MHKAKPVFLVSLGIAAISYVGCQQEAIGNPKRPPDASADAPHPDAAVDAQSDAEPDAEPDAPGPPRAAWGGSR